MNRIFRLTLETKPRPKITDGIAVELRMNLRLAEGPMATTARELPRLASASVWKHCINSFRLMKKCAYCGFENPDDFLKCRECGTSLLPTETGSSTAESEEGWENIAFVNSEAEAERLGLELANRQIPHVLRSYHDSALDGLYQVTHGWGQVQAAPRFKPEILSILQDIRSQTTGESPDQSSEQ